VAGEKLSALCDRTRNVDTISSSTWRENMDLTELQAALDLEYGPAELPERRASTLRGIG
jgi:hypothetical protein